MQKIPSRTKILPLIILPALAVLLLRFGLGRAQPAVSQTTWGPNARANSDPGNASQHEPSLAISRTNSNVVVVAAKDYRHNDNKEVWIYVSQDGGLTWPLDKQIQMPGLPPDIPNESDPVVVARDDGRIYVECLGHNNGHGIFITWSDDNGDSWVNSVYITYNETPYGLDDKDWLALDNHPASPYYHNMYVAWAAGGILLKRSTDGGQTWSSYLNIAPGTTEYPYPVVGADGTLYVFYMDNWGFCATGTIRFVKSTNGGVSFSGPYTVATAYQPCSPIHATDQFRFFSIITAAADPNNAANLWVAWTDDHNVDDGPTDVLYTRSTTGGSSWSTPDRLSHDPVGNGKDHITPVFAIGADSRLHAFWLDRRDDPNDVLFNAYHTSTTDGGLTWEQDNRVSTQAFDLNLYLPPPPGYNAAGDYWGLDTVGNIVMAAWNTTVETSQDIYVARGTFAPMGTLTGLVTDAVTTLPIEAAAVTLDTGQSAPTGADGLYTLQAISGTYTVTAQASGYYSQTVPDVLISGTVTLDFALQPFPILTGQVTDAATAQPLAAALVTLDTGQSASSGPDGVYTLQVVSGTYTVTAQASGYYSQTVPDVEIISGTRTLDFALQPLPAPPVLTGLVRDRWYRTPLSGAQVALDNGLSGFTGPDGIYTLTVPAGVYTVTASASGYFSQTVPSIDLISGMLTLDFDLVPAVCPLPEILAVSVVTDGLTVTFSANITSSLPVSYAWTFGDGFTSTLAAPEHVYTGYGTYTVTLTVTSLTPDGGMCGSNVWSGEVILPAPLRELYFPFIWKE